MRFCRVRPSVCSGVQTREVLIRAKHTMQEEEEVEEVVVVVVRLLQPRCEVNNQRCLKVTRTQR